MKAQNIEDAIKLDSTLVKIEAPKWYVHESYYEVATSTKKADTTNNHQKLTVEALEQANMHLLGVRDAKQFLET